MQKKTILLVGAQKSGKTSVGEILLYLGKVTNRIAKVDLGNTILDYTPVEIKRKCSITMSAAYFDYGTTRINLIDTPGAEDFIGEFLKALAVGDCGVFVVDATSLIDATAEKLLSYCQQYKLPLIFLLNKLEKENTDYTLFLNQAKELKLPVCPVSVAIGKEREFKGIINLLDAKSYIYDGNPIAEKKDVDITQYQSLYESLTERVAEVDDELCEKYLETGELSLDEIKKGLKKGLLEAKLYPFLCASAEKVIGIDFLLEFLLEHAPLHNQRLADEVENVKEFVGYVFNVMQDPFVGELSYVKILKGNIKKGQEVYICSQQRKEKVPQICFLVGKERREFDFASEGDICAFVKFKGPCVFDTLTQGENITLDKIQMPQPVISIAINPKTKEDQEKISNALHKLAEEDLTFKTYYNHELSQTVISGMGEVHLEVTLEKLKERFQTEVIVERLKTAYRETIKKSTKAEGKYKRQSGGRGQYGHTFLLLEPLDWNKEPTFEFVDKIVGGIIPSKYIPAVEKGVRETMKRGILANYPIIWVKTTLYDGSFHEVDSSDIAFQIAAAMAFREGFLKANPVLLEPIMEVEVMTPEEYVGDVIGDLNARRGRIIGIEPQEKYQLIKVYVPEDDMYKYYTKLKGITKGRGSFMMKFSHYEEVPKEKTDKIIEEAKKRKEESK